MQGLFSREHQPEKFVRNLIIEFCIKFNLNLGLFDKL